MNRKIIIVEDEFIVAEDLRVIVEKAGNIVSAIGVSVSEAVELISRYKPGIVLLDINLEGELTGIDLAKQLHNDHIPFIFVSAYSDQNLLQAANATNPYGFLVKPFREQDVLVALDIARYRHENSIESVLRREQLLIASLYAIHSGAGNPDDKLMKVAMALQSYLPFDYLAIGKKSNSEVPYEGISFLRIGIEEYQVIGVEELLNISRMKIDDLKKLQVSTLTEKEIKCYNGSDFDEVCMLNPFKNMLANTFGLESNLTLPIIYINNETVTFSFYSRKEYIYSQAHIAFVGRLYNVLSICSEYITSSLKVRPSTDSHRIRNFEGIVGSDPALINVLDQLKQVAPFDTSVLIQGETGTGKERIAVCIHQLSGRSRKPLVKINCAVLPSSLIESELFGHEKGAFTGATEKRTGKFEQADGGTIFLDEIGEMPIDMQAKLLRVLQEKELERIGGKAPIKVDVRVIAATNRVLEKEVAEGRFRMDLFYRLNVFPLVLPPLRDRLTDITQLSDYFAKRFCKKFDKTFNGITSQMMDSLLRYNWPGNIRELENIIERSVVMNTGNSPLQLYEQLVNHPSLSVKNGIKETPQNMNYLKKIQIDTERAYIISILQKAGGRIRGEGGAAQLLNIPPTTLESKMARLTIKRDDYS